MHVPIRGTARTQRNSAGGVAFFWQETSGLSGTSVPTAEGAADETPSLPGRNRRECNAALAGTEPAGMQRRPCWDEIHQKTYSMMTLQKRHDEARIHKKGKALWISKTSTPPSPTGTS